MSANSIENLTETLKNKAGFEKLTPAEVNDIVIKTNKELLFFGETGVSEMDLSILVNLITYNELIDTSPQAIYRNAFIIVNHRDAMPNRERFNFKWFEAYGTSRKLTFPPFIFEDGNEPKKGDGVPLIGGAIN